MAVAAKNVRGSFGGAMRSGIPAAGRGKQGCEGLGQRLHDAPVRDRPKAKSDTSGVLSMKTSQPSKSWARPAMRWPQYST